MITIDPNEEHNRKCLTDIAPFQRADIRKSVWQLLNTVIPFCALWCTAYLALSVSVWITFAITVPAAGFLVRIFIIFHDCAHHSFFKSRRANEVTGMILGLFSLFPYHLWKYEHAVHHASNGNLSRRGMGDIWTLTVNEYTSLTWLGRLRYRLYRNPFVMFGIGPIFILLFRYRVNRKGAGGRERLNTHLTTFGLIGIIAVLSYAFGWQQFLLVEGPILYLSGAAGIWLFYVQHQFEDGYFERTENWDYVNAALQGSSFYKLPKVLQWMTGNIGLHHIHHLGPRVPNYNLQKIHETIPSVQRVPVVGLMSSFRSLRYRVWDEENKRFIGFRDIMRLASKTET